MLPGAPDRTLPSAPYPCPGPAAPSPSIAEQGQRGRVQPAGSGDPPARPVHARVDQAGQAARAVEGEPPLCAPNPATPARSAPLRRSPAPSPSATRAPRRAGAAACRVSTESRPRPRPVSRCGSRAASGEGRGAMPRAPGMRGTCHSLNQACRASTRWSTASSRCCSASGSSPAGAPAAPGLTPLLLTRRSCSLLGISSACRALDD